MLHIKDHWVDGCFVFLLDSGHYLLASTVMGSMLHHIHDVH